MDAWGTGSSVIGTCFMQQKQQCVSRTRAPPLQGICCPSSSSMVPTHFCASSSAPILTAMAMGARRMGCSSETMVKFGAGNSTDESLQQGRDGQGERGAHVSVSQSGGWVGSARLLVTKH